MKKYLTVARINFRYTTWIAYLVSAICLVAMAVDIIVDRCIGNIDDTSISLYSMLYIVCIMAPVFIASVNYNKLMNIGVKKKAYFFGCIINYVVFAAIVSLLSTLEITFIDGILAENGHNTISLVHVFGWDGDVLTSFFSQFAFLLMFQSLVHTLTFMQTRWYGWAADLLIVTIISVFTPIPVLRQAEIFVFDMVIFSPAVVHIPVCLGLALLFYATNLYYLKKRSA